MASFWVVYASVTAQGPDDVVEGLEEVGGMDVSCRASVAVIGVGVVCVGVDVVGVGVVVAWW